MSREEALNTWLPVIQIGVENIPECNDALEMAIKALEQEPCEDAISREAVIDIIEDVCPIYGNDYRYILREKVNELPPVKPQEPKTDYKAFAEWVAREVFSDTWELDKDAFAEIACRKLAKLGMVEESGDSWVLMESEGEE